MDFSTIKAVPVPVPVPPADAESENNQSQEPPSQSEEWQVLNNNVQTDTHNTNSMQDSDHTTTIATDNSNPNPNPNPNRNANANVQGESDGGALITNAEELETDADLLTIQMNSLSEEMHRDAKAIAQTAKQMKLQKKAMTKNRGPNDEDTDTDEYKELSSTTASADSQLQLQLQQQLLQQQQLRQQKQLTYNMYGSTVRAPRNEKWFQDRNTKLLIGIAIIAVGAFIIYKRFYNRSSSVDVPDTQPSVIIRPQIKWKSFIKPLKRI